MCCDDVEFLRHHIIRCGFLSRDKWRTTITTVIRCGFGRGIGDGCLDTLALMLPPLAHVTINTQFTCDWGQHHSIDSAF